MQDTETQNLLVDRVMSCCVIFIDLYLIVHCRMGFISPSHSYKGIMYQCLPL